MGKQGIVSFLAKLFTSGYQVEAGNEAQQERLMRHVVLNGVIYLSIFLLVSFAIQSQQSGKTWQAIANLLEALFLVLGWILLRTRKDFIPAALVSMIPGGVLFLWLAATHGVSNSGILWSYAYPLVAVFLLGIRGGAALSGFYFAALTVIVLVPGVAEAPHYELTFSLRVLGVYFLVTSMCLIYEYSRQQKDRTVLRLTRTLKAERDEMSAMKDNMTDAIFLLDGEFMLLPQYSHSLEEILGKADLSGRFFPDLLDASLNEKERCSLADYFRMVLEQSFDSDMLADLNPLDGFVHARSAGSDQRFLRCSFASIMREDGQACLLGTMSDQTRTWQLQQDLKAEEAKRQNDMRALFEIIHVEPRVLHDFIEDAEYEFQRINGCLMDKHRPSEQVMVEIYQSLHAIKSNAVILGLESLGEKIHAIEQEVAKLRERSDVPFSDVLHVTVGIERIQQEKDKLKELINKIVAFRFGEGRLQEEYVLVRTLEKVIEKVGNDLGKRAVLQIDKVEAQAVENGPRRIIKELLIQMVRNAMYHGIEMPAERSAAGKTESGTIRLSVACQDGKIQIVLGDDGRGLDYQAIAHKAKERGLIKDDERLRDRNALLQVLFSPGFSTAAAADLHAGRGVGLSMVRDRVREAGGNIRLQSDEGKGMTIKITMPMSQDVEEVESINGSLAAG